MEFEDVGFCGERKTGEPGNIGRIGGRRVLSSLHHLCPPKRTVRDEFYEVVRRTFGETLGQDLSGHPKCAIGSDQPK